MDSVKDRLIDKVLDYTLFAIVAIILTVSILALLYFVIRNTLANMGAQVKMPTWQNLKGVLTNN